MAKRPARRTPEEVDLTADRIEAGVGTEAVASMRDAHAATINDELAK